jgi:hypothetical protein
VHGWSLGKILRTAGFQLVVPILGSSMLASPRPWRTSLQLR